MINLTNKDIEELSNLPTRQSKSKYLTEKYGNVWNVMDYGHSWYETDEYRKVRAIINNSVGKNIEQIKGKIRGLIPQSESLEDMLYWYYDFLTIDKRILRRNGTIDDNKRYWHSHKLLVRLDGYIIRSPRYKSGIKPISVTKETYEKLSAQRREKYQLEKDIEFIEKYELSILNNPEKFENFKKNGNIYTFQGTRSGYRRPTVDSEAVKIVKEEILAGRL